MIHVFLWLGLAISGVSWADPPTPKNFQRSAEGDFELGDFYQAYRVLSGLEAKRPDFFGEKSLEIYLKSIWVTGSPEFLAEECARLSRHSSKIVARRSSYLCGLYSLRSRKPDQAEKFLNNVTKDSGLYWPAQILLASASLFTNFPEQGLKKLEIKDLPQYEKRGLKAQFFMVKARLLSMMEKWEDAVQAYQNIGIKDPQYSDALFESIFVLFKQRKFETVRVLSDVLMASYASTSQVGNMKVPASYYFQTKYLRAYIELLELQQEVASQSFISLKSEYEDFVKKLRGELVASKATNLFKNEIHKWPDVRTFPPVIETQLAAIGDWMGPDLRLDMERLILQQVALSQESKRTRTYSVAFMGQLESYPAKIDRLKGFNLAVLTKKYESNVSRLNKALNGLTLKTEMARLEVAWMGRAQGARTMDDIIESYRQEVGALGDLTEE